MLSTMDVCLPWGHDDPLAAPSIPRSHGPGEGDPTPSRPTVGGSPFRRGSSLLLNMRLQGFRCGTVWAAALPPQLCTGGGSEGVEAPFDSDVTVQGWPPDVSTTMIYTLVLNPGPVEGPKPSRSDCPLMSEVRGGIARMATAGMISCGASRLSPRARLVDGLQGGGRDGDPESRA